MFEFIQRGVQEFQVSAKHGRGTKCLRAFGCAGLHWSVGPLASAEMGLPLRKENSFQTDSGCKNIEPG